MKILPILIVAVIALSSVAAGIAHNPHILQEVFSSSTAFAGQSLSCGLSGSVVTSGQGVKTASFTPTFSPATAKTFIYNPQTWESDVPLVSGQTITGPVISGVPLNYILIVTDNTSTTTCNVTLTP
jgi:hypothetical protein